MSYKAAARSGAKPDVEVIYAFNRTGASVAKGYVGVLNDNGTNASYDDYDSSDTDADKNVIAMTATDVECRAVVAMETIPDGEIGRWAIRGRVQAKVASQAGDATTVVRNSPITLSSHITDVSTVSAGQFTSRNKTGSGSLDAMTVRVMTFGRTRESTTNTAALTWIDLYGDGHPAGYGG